MPNTTGPAAAEGLPSLYRLLATYWDQYEAACVAMHHTDKMKCGSPEHHIAMQEQIAAGEALDATSDAICAFAPRFIFDAAIKANFVSYLAQANGGSLDSRATFALLASLPNLVVWEGADR